MDYNIATLEIADLLVHFEYYNGLTVMLLGQKPDDDHLKIRNKHAQHLAQHLPEVILVDNKKQLKSISVLKAPIMAKLKTLKSKEIHELIELLEKDAKKIKKLYKSLS